MLGFSEFSECKTFVGLVVSGVLFDLIVESVTVIAAVAVIKEEVIVKVERIRLLYDTLFVILFVNQHSSYKNGRKCAEDYNNLDQSIGAVVLVFHTINILSEYISGCIISQTSENVNIFLAVFLKIIIINHIKSCIFYQTMLYYCIMKKEILCMMPYELEDMLRAYGEKAYKAKQIFAWLHRGATFDEMSDISKKTRQFLSENTTLVYPEIVQKQVSKLDGTVKYLFSMYDGQLIESVVMRYKHGNSICISSQAGCRMGCRFCASTLGGKARDLSSGEILSQIIVAQKDIGERIDNVVMMGIGEPLDNYDNVIRFLELVGAPGGLNIGYRHISLSTCGLVDRIYRLAEEEYPITLSISLHATRDEERDEIMPINKKWGIDELLSACRAYFDKTGRRISFEYTLIHGKNDTPAHAKRLASLLLKYFDKAPFHVNLIPVNTVAESGFTAGNEQSIKRFTEILEKSGVNATRRRRLGSDIDASCGQLRHKNSNK